MPVASADLSPGDVVDDPVAGTFLVLSNRVDDKRRRIVWLVLKPGEGHEAHGGATVLQVVLADTVFKDCDFILRGSAAWNT